MRSVSIYDYPDFSHFLASYIDARKSADSSYSYERLCRRSGVRSISSLAMIARGQRVPTPEIALRICRALDLSKKECDYADALVGLQRARDDESRAHYSRVLDSMRPNRRLTPIDLDGFEVISKWYHLAILEMFNLKDFRSDEGWITRRLGRKVYLREVRRAISRLCRLKLVSVQEDGSYQRTSVGLTTPDNIPSDAIREYHSDMMTIAQDALSLPVDRRYFSGATLTVKQEKMGQAQEMINDFFDRFSNLLESEEGDDTFQLHVSFFPLTKKITCSEPSPNRSEREAEKEGED